MIKKHNRIRAHYRKFSKFQDKEKILNTFQDEKKKIPRNFRHARGLKEKVFILELFTKANYKSSVKT